MLPGANNQPEKHLPNIALKSFQLLPCVTTYKGNVCYKVRTVVVVGIMKLSWWHRVCYEIIRLTYFPKKSTIGK